MSNGASVAIGIISVADAIRAIITAWAESERAKGLTDAEIETEYAALKADLNDPSWDARLLPDV